MASDSTSMPPLRRPDSPSPPPLTWRMCLRWHLFCLLIFVGVGDGVPRPPPPSETDYGGRIVPFREEVEQLRDAAEGHEGAIDGERRRPPPAGDALGPGVVPDGIEEDQAIRVAPQYMLELYRKFSNDKYSHPIANIVRSFQSINTGAPAVWTSSNSTSTRLHTLQFNISSVGDGEEIFLAELRLFTSTKTQRILVYEVVNTILPSAAESYDGDETRSSTLRYRLLASRDRSPSAGNWETFAVTDAVRRWVKTRATAGHILEVRVDTTAAAREGGPQKEDGGGGEGVADGGEEGFGAGGYEPIIVVFSNDRKRRKVELRELHEIETRENEARVNEEDEDEEETRRRSRDKNDYFPHPLSSSTSSSEVEDIEEDEEDYDVDADTARNQRNSTYEVSSASSSSPPAAAAWSNHSRPKSLSDPKKSTRVKRTLLNRGRHRRGERRNSCRRKPMFVDFRDVKWENWIIQPQGYQAYECTGQCYFPLGPHLTPTKYAMVKSLLHATYPKRASAVCCVPTRLEPISLLYLDEEGIVTYKYEYDGMVVAECGCR